MQPIWNKVNVKYKLEMFPEVVDQTLLEYKEFRRGCGLDLPSTTLIMKLFGSWNGFKDEVYRNGGVPKQRLLPWYKL